MKPWEQVRPEGYRWRIWYADGSAVQGRTKAEWDAAPAEGVQYVVLYKKPPPDQRPWRGVSDRYLWTGEDTYRPFGKGWSQKRGSLIDDEAYHGMWDEVAYGER